MLAEILGKTYTFSLDCNTLGKSYISCSQARFLVHKTCHTPNITNEFLGPLTVEQR
ncbi:hypothetical protein Hanom_Chr07g00648701 [Helianthus anomalus]